jgi:UPF0271 protein
MPSSATTPLVTLNADLGESFGAYTMGDDAALMEIIQSANIACGFHAGDPDIMRQTVRLAAAQGVSIGAHPSFPDLQGFGRRRMTFSAREVENLVAYQIGALMAIAASEGAAVTHVKPHGALSNTAAEDPVFADAVAKAVSGVDTGLILLSPCRSELSAAGQRQGLKVAEEAFADRTYAASGALAPRSQLGAVLHDVAEVTAHVQRMLHSQALWTLDGAALPTPIHSICVHGDGQSAVQIARAVRTTLETNGYTLAPLPMHFPL